LPFQWYLDGPWVMRPPATNLFSRSMSKILLDSFLEGQLIKIWQNFFSFRFVCPIFYNKSVRNITFGTDFEIFYNKKIGR